MTRQSKKSSRTTRRREEAALKLVVIGGALAVAPLFFHKSPIGKAFAALMPIGLLMLGVGILLLWLRRQEARRTNLQAGSEGADTPQQPMRRPIYQTPPVDRTVTELERNTDATKPPGQAPAERPTEWSRAVFNVIEWRRFEAVVEALFQQAGFETKSQSHGADEGVDVWLYSRNQPGHPVSLVQCKHWNDKPVGVDKIRELRGVMAARNVPRGQFATTSVFTDTATDFARANGINLLDVSGLLGLIETRTFQQQQALLDVALEGDYWRPTCVNCGVKMVSRTPRNGGKAFWGCVNYPRRCKKTLPMRGS